MVEIGPNLTTVLLALVAIVSLVAQSHLANHHEENQSKIQRQPPLPPAQSL